MSGQAGIAKSVAGEEGQQAGQAPTAFGFAVPGGVAGQAPPAGQAGQADQTEVVVVDLAPAGEFEQVGQSAKAGQEEGATVSEPAGQSPTPPEPVHAVLPAIAPVAAGPGGSAKPVGVAQAGGAAGPAASPIQQPPGQSSQPVGTAASPTVPPGQWLPTAGVPTVGDQVLPQDAGQVLVGTASARAAPAQAGSRVRSKSRTRAFGSARDQASGPGPSAAPGGGQAPPPRDGQSDADPPRLVAPGGALWAARLAEAGAPVGQSMGWAEFERSVQAAAMGLGQSVPIWPGPAVEAGTTEDLVRPRSVWTLRDHIGQLQRELGQVDALLVAGWFGQMDSPPLRRGLVTAAGNLLPVVQAHRPKMFCLFWRSRHRPDL